MTICSHMKCPFCSKNTKVYNSRSTHYSTQTWRRRQCLNCNKSFTTKEKVDWTGLISIRTPDDTSEYNHERLQLSIIRASDRINLPTDMITELTDSIELALRANGFFNTQEQDSSVITTTATTVIQRYNRNMALQYVNHVYSNQPPHELVKSLIES